MMTPNDLAAGDRGPIAPEIGLSLSPEVEFTEAEALADWLRENAVEEVECVTPDFAGVGRGKVMPAAKFCQFQPVFLPTSLFFLTITGGYPDLENFRGYNTDADLMLRPDLPTCRAVPWAADPSVQVIHDVCDRRGRLVEFAPRSVLRRIIALYEKQGWHPVVAPEIEFYLTKPNTDPDYPLEPPVGRSGRIGAKSQAYSISAVDEYDTVIEHIYDYAAAQGLEIDTIIQEAGAAQLEINLNHGKPLELADQVFLFKRLIREAALRCGSYATFMAKPMAEQPGSAMHIHQSVVSIDTGENIFSGRGRRALGRVLSLPGRAADLFPGGGVAGRALCQLVPAAGAAPDGADQPGLGPGQPDDGAARADLGPPGAARREPRRRGGCKPISCDRGLPCHRIPGDDAEDPAARAGAVGQL